MTEKGRKHLANWCRFARIDDSDEDGICEFILKFKVRGENMQVWMSSLTYDDACEIAASIVGTACPGCEDFMDDWLDPDSGFAIDYRLEDDFIVMEGSYRT